MPQSERPLRVAHVMHSALAGSERVLVRLLSRLDRSATQSLVVLPGDGPLRGELETLGVDVHLLPTSWWIPATNWSAERFLGQLEGVETRAAELARMFERERVDLVHTQFIVTLEGALAAAALSLPHVWHSRGLFGGGFPPAYFDDVPFLYSTTDALTDALICVSAEVGRQASAWVQREALHVVHDGVDTASIRAASAEPRAAVLRRLGIPASARVVACVGGIQRRKGQLDLIEAAPRVLASHPDVVFAFAGGFNDADYHAEVVRRAMELGVTENVRLLGQLDDVRGLLAASTALVHPSHSEGFGLAVVEAMALGLPVVATRCGGPEEIVEDGVSGELVPVADPAAIAATLVTLLGDTGRAATLGAGAAVRASAFDLARTARATEEVYASVVRRPSRPVEVRRRAAEALASELLTRARRAAATALRAAP
jgi:glycosyltransferase involved in cell wall biosynthesis